MFLKRILCALLFMAAIQVQAQSVNTLLGNFRGTNNTTITIKTAPNSITPVNVGGNIDSTCKYLSLWGLQEACNVNSRTYTQVAFGRVSSHQTVVDSNGVTDTYSSSAIWQFTNTGGVGLWLMKSRSNANLIAILPSAISSNETIYLPNKPGAVDTFATLSDITAMAGGAQITQSVSLTSPYTISSATASVNSPVYIIVSAQSANLTFSAPAGSWTNGQHLILIYEDNGTTRTITHNAKFRQGGPVTYFTATVPGQSYKEEYIYNSTASGGPYFDLVGATYN